MIALQILLGDSGEEVCGAVGAALNSLGHNIVARATTAQDLLETLQNQAVDAVITGLSFADAAGLEMLTSLQSHRLPVVVVGDALNEAVLEEVGNHHVMSYLVQPFPPANLQAALQLAVQRFASWLALQDENAALTKSLHERKLVERAKGILMRRAALDEEAAYRRLQKLAREQARPMVEIAQSIITAEEAFKR